MLQHKKQYMAHLSGSSVFVKNQAYGYFAMIGLLPLPRQLLEAKLYSPHRKERLKDRKGS
jgi:hypothetical protein